MKYLLLLPLLWPFFAVAQNNTCGTDAFNTQLKERYPRAAVNEAEQNQLLYNYLLQQNGTPKTTYDIPVVFHIVHQNGPENLTDQQIIDAVTECNERLANMGVYYDEFGHAATYRLCLASLDPFGNPTNGITRHESPLTVIGSTTFNQMDDDMALKNLERWNPFTYINVWIVNTVVGSQAGYATYPNTYNEGHQGIVLEYPTLVDYDMLIHELGHYFLLYHTFDGVPCRNFNCLQDGDKICDTPVDLTQYDCLLDLCNTDTADTTGLSPFTTNVAEIPNYMDYSTCAHSFTQGQVDRMDATLLQLRPEFVLSNGCGEHPGMPVPVASFTIDSSYCTGRLRLTSTSTNSQYTAWDFEHDGLIDTIGPDIYHTFPATGYYTIQMLVSGYGGSDTISQTVYVRVLPNPDYPIDNFTNIYYDTILDIQMTCPGVEASFSGVPGMTSYQWSTGQTTEDIAFTVEDDFTLTLTATDANGLSWTNCRTFAPQISPRLSIGSTSNDTVWCTDYVMLSLEPTPWYNTISNTWYRNGEPVTSNQILYPFLAYPAGEMAFHVTNTDINGCTLQSDTFLLTIVEPPAPTLTQHGNVLTLDRDCINVEWYLDGEVIINSGFDDSSEVITELGCYYVRCQDCDWKNSDTVCVTSFDVGLPSLSEQLPVVAPNPFNGTISIQFTSIQQQTEVLIRDLNGKLLDVFTLQGTDVLKADLAHYVKGMYLLEIRNAAQERATLRIVKE